MGMIGNKLRSLEGGRVAFHCPGCGERHQVTVYAASSGPAWGYNGNPDAPTFTPSVLVTGPARWPTDEEHERIMAGEKIDLPQMRCHSFVTDGRIQFLGDCTHALAGQTVDLPDIGD